PPDGDALDAVVHHNGVDPGIAWRTHGAAGVADLNAAFLPSASFWQGLAKAEIAQAGEREYLGSCTFFCRLAVVRQFGRGSVRRASACGKRERDSRKQGQATTKTAPFHQAGTPRKACRVLRGVPYLLIQQKSRFHSRFPMLEWGGRCVALLLLIGQYRRNYQVHGFPL